MMNATTTPPDITRAIFPIKGNEAALTEAAISFGVIAFPETNVILFEGNLKDYHALKETLIGGVTA